MPLLMPPGWQEYNAAMAVTLNTPSPQPNPRRHQITRAEYPLLGESGLLGEGRRYELVNGDPLETMPLKQPRPGLVQRLLLILMAIFGGEFVGCPMPVVLSDDTEPEGYRTVGVLNEAQSAYRPWRRRTLRCESWIFCRE